MIIGGGGWGSLQRPCPVLPAADALDQRSVEVVGRRISPPAMLRGAVSADGWLRRRAVMRGAVRGDPHRHRLPALVRWLVTPFHPGGRRVCPTSYRDDPKPGRQPHVKVEAARNPFHRAARKLGVLEVRKIRVRMRGPRSGWR
eukprot:COSAG01_NODE_11558_length_1903_cov_257.864745_1_plen_142_part_10